jgi:RNA polymerase sigma-70 factor (ECF subfamily)
MDFMRFAIGALFSRRNNRKDSHRQSCRHSRFMMAEAIREKVLLFLKGSPSNCLIHGVKLCTFPERHAGQRQSEMNSRIVNHPAFTTTHWSMVLAAGRKESRQADEALERLCRMYWYPIFIFLRRSGWMAHDAEDLTQAFFERVLQKDYLHAVDRNKGKFRSFLLAMLRHFIANYRRDARAQKRGGHFRFMSIEDDSIGKQDLTSALAGGSPEQSFERQWALTLLEHVVNRLRDEFLAAGKADQFEGLKIFLTGDKHARSYGELAVQFRTSEAALKMAVSRMRRRYGELLREEIESTVSTREEADEEMRALFAAIG